MMDNIVILNNDCMLELKKLPDNSIDCVITDRCTCSTSIFRKWYDCNSM